MCDIAPLEFSDVLLGQPYMWRYHVVYESRPRSVIITLGKGFYKIPEVDPKAFDSLMSSKLQEGHCIDWEIHPFHDSLSK